MSKRQERSERRIERIESYLSILADQINANLPSANIPTIWLSGIFEDSSESKFIWGEKAAGACIQRGDYNYLVDTVFSQLPEILVPEIRSNYSTDKAIDLGILTAIMSASGLGEPHGPCGPEVSRLVSHQLKGRPSFYDVRHMDGVVSLVLNGEVIPTEFTIKDLPVSYFKWGFLKFEESNIMPDFSSGLIDASRLRALLQNIQLRMNESERSFRILDEGELKIDDRFLLRITNGAVVLSTISLGLIDASRGQIAVKMHLHESKPDVDFTVTIKSGNVMSEYEHDHQVYERIMSNDVSYVDAVNIINSLLNIEELLTSPKFKETLLVLEVGV